MPSDYSPAVTKTGDAVGQIQKALLHRGLVIPEHNHDGGLVKGPEILHQGAEGRVGLARQGEVLLRHGVLPRRVGYGDLRRVVRHGIAAVVLDGDVEQEQRLPFLLVLKLPDNLFKVGLVADVAVLEGLGHIHVVAALVGVEAQPGVGPVSLPRGPLPGVEGQGGIALRLQNGGQGGGGPQHILLVGDAARGQEGHGVAGEELELGVAGAAAKRGNVEHAALQSVGQVLEELRALIVRMQVLVDGEIREGLVHDGDDRGLFLIKLRDGLRALNACSLVGIILVRVVRNELLSLVHVIILGHGRLDGLGARDKAGQETLTVVALKRTPGINLNAKRVVIIDQRHVGTHARQACDAHHKVDEQRAAIAAIALGTKHSGHAAQLHGDGHERHAIQTEGRQDVGVASAGNGHRGRQGGNVTRSDGHRLEGDDEILDDAQNAHEHGDDRGRGMTALGDEEHPGHDGGNERPLEQQAKRIHPQQVVIAGDLQPQRRARARQEQQNHARDERMGEAAGRTRDLQQALAHQIALKIKPGATRKNRVEDKRRQHVVGDAAHCRVEPYSKLQHGEKNNRKHGRSACGARVLVQGAYLADGQGDRCRKGNKGDDGYEHTDPSLLGMPRAAACGRSLLRTC